MLMPLPLHFPMKCVMQSKKAGYIVGKVSSPNKM